MMIDEGKERKGKIRAGSKNGKRKQNLVSLKSQMKTKYVSRKCKRRICKKDD